MKKPFLVLYVFLLFPALLLAQLRDESGYKYAKQISPEHLKELLYILAADDMEGRETAMPGQKKAADFIAKYYAQAGIPGHKSTAKGNEVYFQTVPLVKESMKDCRIVVGSKTFSFIKDFYRFPGYMPEKVSLSQLAFVGYGQDNESYSDYKGMDVTGKTVMVVMNDPIFNEGKKAAANQRVSQEYKQKRSIAQSKGAAAVVFINTSYDYYISRIKLFLEQERITLDKKTEVENSDVIPTVFVSPGVANKLLKRGKKKPFEKYLKKSKKTGQPQSFYFGIQDGEILLNKSLTSTSSENILAYIEGSDPVLKNELVVVTGHYDHIGVANGEINNGADDDASGTVCTMTLAAMMQKAKSEGFGPKRSVLIINFTGEEKGLLGSEWYTDFPVFPLENTNCNLNIDMVGRHDAEHEGLPEYIYIIGSDFLSTELHDMSLKVRESYSDLAYDYRYNSPSEPNRFYYRSDHYNFAKNGIPSIFYFSGVHEDYHKPTDTAEKINYEKLAKVARLVFMTAWHAANADKKFAVDVEEPK